MADNDVKIKVSLDGADTVQKGLAGVGDSASETDSKLGGLISGGLKGAGVALAGFAAAGVAASAALAVGVVDAYSQYEQNIGGIETLFGASAGKMEAYANDAYKTAGLSANEYMSQATSFSAALLQGLGGDTDKAAEVANRAITDMSDNAAKFGSDIGSIQNAYQGFSKQNFTMLDNLKLGYGGTAAEMARLVNDSGVMGDSFTATAENINSVSYDKVIAAIGAVQDKMGVTGTTAREASATISGSIDTLKGAWDNLLVGLGSADADVGALAGNVISSFEQVLTNITPVIENIGTNIATLGPKLGEMAQSLIAAIAAALPAIIQAGVSIISGLIQGIVSALPSLISAIVPALVGLVQTVAVLAPQLISAGAQAIIALAQGLADAAPTLIPAIINGILGMVNALITALPMMINAGLNLITGLVQGIMTAIPMIIAALPGIIENIVTFIATSIPMIIDAGISLFVSLIEALPDIINTIVAALPEIITSIIGAVLGAIPLIIDAGIQLLVSLVKNLPAIITALVAAIPAIITSIISAVLGAIPQLIMAGVQLLVALVQNLPTIIVTIVAAIPQIIGGLISALVGSIPAFISMGGDLLRGLWQGMEDMGGWIIAQVEGFFGGFVDIIKGILGIHSPSTVMAEIGKFVGQGFIVGLKGTESQVTKAASDMTDKIRKAMSEGKISKKTGNALIDKINKDTKAIKAAIEKRAKVADQLKDAQKKLADLQKDRLGVISDIQDKASDVDLTDNKSVDSMKKELEDRIKAVAAFRVKLANLEKLGLDSTTRDQLLNEFLSTGNTQAADTLLAGGKTAVKEIADLQKNLSTEGLKLGTAVGDDMYKAGIQSAQGLVNGLTSQQKNLDAAAKALGDGLVKAVKKSLGIKSPSRRFRDEVGAMLTAGIGVGIENTEGLALKPLTQLNAKIMHEATAIPDLTVRSEVEATATATQVPMSYTTTQVVQFGEMMVESLVKALEQVQFNPTVQANIAERDMASMARQTADALRSVRAADGRAASLSVQQGAR